MSWIERFASESDEAVLTILRLVKNSADSVLAGIGGHQERECGIGLSKRRSFRKDLLDQLERSLTSRSPFFTDGFDLAQLLQGCADPSIEWHILTKVVGHAQKGFHLLTGSRNRKVMEGCDLIRIGFDGVTRNDVTQDRELSESKLTLVEVKSETS